MLYWPVMFLVVALVAAVFGFSGVAAASAGLSRALFGVFLVLFLVSVCAQFIYSA